MFKNIFHFFLWSKQSYEENAQILRSTIVIFHLEYYLVVGEAPLVAQLIKNLPAIQETLVQFLDQEDPLEKGQSIHTSILELPCWLRWSTIHLQCGRPGFDPQAGKIPWRRAWQPTPIFLPGEAPWTGSPVGYSPWGCRVDTTEQLSTTQYYYVVTSRWSFLQTNVIT